MIKRRSVLKLLAANALAAPAIMTVARPGFANLRRLDTSHGCQDHTVLPYAASSAKPSASQCRRPDFWRKRLSAVIVSAHPDYASSLLLPT